MNSLSNKIALVTGASSGIGEALCRLLVARGYHCIAIARREEKLARIAKDIDGPGKFSYYTCDVASREQVYEVSHALQKNGTIPQFFFLNAGMTGLPAIDPKKALADHHRALFDVNYLGVVHWIDAWRDLCLERGSGTFLVTSSVNAIFSPPTGCGYAASKAAVSKLFEGLDLQYHKSGVHFLSCTTGPVRTDGLVGKLPFTWPTEKMAGALLRQAKAGRARATPSKFYWLLAHLLRLLPYKITLKLLSKL